MAQVAAQSGPEPGGVRAQGARQHLVLLVAAALARRGPGLRPPDVFSAVDLEHTLARVVHALPPRQRAVVVLRFFEDLSVEETAQLPGCRPGTVKSRTAKALRVLREQLTDERDRDGTERGTRPVRDTDDVLEQRLRALLNGAAPPAHRAARPDAADPPPGRGAPPPRRRARH
ncbi:sigma factor-like helix-turn-helix DNA-binding protein, partial [Streptomyces tremellae]|uniref:sigma factor-like helix-turn-helix DNA-binding protein n=1 Tax=Streptomyces tremellae TaxID=1124239 RepID=UPI0031EA1230